MNASTELMQVVLNIRKHLIKHYQDASVVYCLSDVSAMSIEGIAELFDKNNQTIIMLANAIERAVYDVLNNSVSTPCEYSE